MEGDIEAGAGARQATETKLRDLISQLADLDAACHTLQTRIKTIDATAGGKAEPPPPPPGSWT
eukprot:12255909-Prorocentrum_lima.AAC.1